MKELIEKRNALVEELEQLLATAKAEKRALTDEENTLFEAKKAEVAQYDKTIKAQEEFRALNLKPAGTADGDDDSEAEKRALEERAFISYMRGETSSMTAGENSKIIPTHIANRIIKAVSERSPILTMATVFNIGGNLAFPIFDKGTLTASFVDEATAPDLGKGSFDTIKLESYIVTAQTAISRKLLSNSDIDVLPFIISQVAEAIADFLEEKLIVGATVLNESDSSTKISMDGVMKAPTAVTTDNPSAITAEDLIDLQMSVPTVYQNKACWIMHSKTAAALRKLKDGEGRYFLQQNLREGFPYMLLGKPVYITDSAPQIASGETVIAYGDMSGLYVKFAQAIEVRLDTSKYSNKYMWGIEAFTEVDAKLVETQKIRTLKMKA